MDSSVSPQNIHNLSDILTVIMILTAYSKVLFAILIPQTYSEITLNTIQYYSELCKTAFLKIQIVQTYIEHRKQITFMAMGSITYVYGFSKI